ncbi:MAG: LysR family transcriptional regulator [Oscillospiraceae bacterium]|nr:LysR family transcriptional regulator [Oscillospiraceae bacterium]
MNFTRIEYFLAAAEYLNFTKAANVLYITQPSLSKQIALLEDELGLALFERNPRDLQLTPAGKLLYHEFKKLMPEIDAITEKVKRLKYEKNETLYIGCIEAVNLDGTAAKIIRDYSQNAKNVEIFIERYGFGTLHNKVIDGSIDLAFTFSTQIGKIKDIMCAVVEHRRRYIIMSSKHKLAANDDINIEDLEGETFVLHSRSEATALCDDILEECGQLGFYPEIRYADTVDALLDYLELTGGVAFLDKSITDSRPGRLKYFPTKVEKPFDMVCIWKKNNNNPALRAFIKKLTTMGVPPPQPGHSGTRR